MMFVNSLKLFGSNWSKALKYLLYYFVVMGICFALFLPTFFEFKDLTIAAFQKTSALSSFSGVFQESLGQGLHHTIVTFHSLFLQAADKNLGLLIYGLIIAFVVLPFLISLGGYVLDTMLYSYMTSKSKIGFFSALIKTLRSSWIYALIKTFYNLLFVVIVVGATYGLGQIENEGFIQNFLPLTEFLVLVLLFSLNGVLTLGWAPAIIVFDCNAISGYRKGLKAVKRHFWTIFGTTLLYFVLFWGLVMIFGAYTLVVLAPLMSALLCMYKMIVFFTSQGMRFYISNDKIMTPKKLEEVDNINKTAFIL